MAEATPIAIVGLGGVFPGALDLETFARNIFAGLDVTRRVPLGRWILDPRDVCRDQPGPDAACSDRACFVEGFSFDPAGLDIDPAVLAGLDPLYSLVLHTGRQAWQDAVTGSVDRERVGVMLAAIALPTDGSSAITRDILGRSFEHALLGAASTSHTPVCHGRVGRESTAGWHGRVGREPAQAEDRDHPTSPLNAHVTALPAALLATALGLRGGSLTLDAACASSLYAIKLACDELREGRTDAMLAGGVSRPESLYTQMGFSQLQALSPIGCCRPFDADADGLVVGEGAGIVLLKRVEDAVRDGDHIYAVIRGIGLSNDIAGSLLAADPEGQLRAMRAAYEQAGWSPTDVDLIECHGTGTPVGDAAELKSMHTLWEDHEWRTAQCAIGAIKSMIGHLLTAAGAAGLIKVLLALQEERLPPSANYQRPAVGFDQDHSPFRVQAQPAAWSRRDRKTPRRAAVSAFGFGGINAHLLIEEWDPALPVNKRLKRKKRDAAKLTSNDARSPIAIVGLEARVGELGSLREFKDLELERLELEKLELERLGLPNGVAASSCHPDRDRQVARRDLATNLSSPQPCNQIPPSPAIGGLGRDDRQESSISAPTQKSMLSGESALRPRPPDRWRGCDDLVADRLGNRALPGAYIDSLRVNVGEFHMPPSEIPEVLPQQMLMLQVVAGALADAGMHSRERRERSGVIIGMGLDLNTTNYHHRWILLSQARRWADELDLDLSEAELTEWVAELRDAAGPALNAARVVGALGNIVASRIAREFAFGGPSFAISAEEASGLRALEVGARALQRNELDSVIVGAVDLAGDVRAVLARHALRPYSASGQVRPFDATADGTLPGEGAVAMVLKRLEDAQADGDQVYAIVRGLGFAGGDLPARPTQQTYELAVERACTDADVQPASISHIEAHGSGDPEEDHIEAHALAARFGTPDAEPPTITSVKTSVGHTGAAAGLVSCAKAALSLCRQETPPRGDQSGVPRRAGVSAIGIDGTCAHVVLEECNVQNAATRQRESCDARQTSQGRSREIVLPTGAPPPQPTLPRRAVLARHSDRGRQWRPTEESGNAGARGQIPRSLHSLGTTAGSTLPPDLATTVAETGAATTRAHEAYLRFSETSMRGMGAALAMEAYLLERLGVLPDAGANLPDGEFHRLQAGATPRAGVTTPAYPREICMEFAVGSVAKVLGPEFAEVDTYRARVRLPDEPLMLVDRILSIAGEKGSLTRGTIITEHDVLPDAWYLDGGRAPVCITVEAGQADLFLCSYLGIDLVVKGTRTYRLLDATVHFHRDLPRPGETIRYEINIDNFVRQGNTHLFFFRFVGSINGQPVLTMTDGCAGFFTEEEIEHSGGIVLTAEDQQPTPGRRPADWRELIPMQRESYNEQQLDALRAGDLEGCFGPAFAGLGLEDPLRIPSGRMRLVHRVAELDPTGGRFGLGLIRAEADVQPDDWFLTCHFVDDMVMPGTLMYECCAHTLRILLLRMGWVGEQTGVCYEPCRDVPAKLKCRGPVTPKTKVVTYEVQLKEIGYAPEPYVIADALMYADGRRIVQFTDMSMRLSGLTRAQIEATWRNQGQPCGTGLQPVNTAGAEPGRYEWDTNTPTTAPKPALFDTDRIVAFAIGSPTYAYGDRYRPFEHNRRIARLPAPPFSFLTRITEIHARQWELEPSSWIEAQYDVPPTAWYFRANRQPSMPHCVTQESALQACGWLAAYLGAALRSEQDLRFRNLGGQATMHQEVFPDAGTLTTRVRLTKVSQAGDTILLDYDAQVWQRGELAYACQTTFGFFTDGALTQQVGIRDITERLYIPSPEDTRRGEQFALETCAPLDPDDTDATPGPPAALPARALRMIDEIELYVPDGGRHGLGFIRGVKDVDPQEWFFKAHFYQDPVCPGSLGLEAFVQLLKVVALRRWPTLEHTHRFEPIAIGAAHTWRYRGQTVPTSRRVEVEALITDVEDGPRPRIMASGFLKVDGTVIYEMTDFAVRLVPVD
jgi:acyl transferase domain-containing protein/3-hydroxymyristoyl/3-hydroxydecanoyl-(acyl carrier protein) dehydratase